jgi:hypothetical protein
MGSRHAWVSWLGMCVLAVGPRLALAQRADLSASSSQSPKVATMPASFVTPQVLEQVPEAVRMRVRSVVERPTLRTQGPLEAFTCQPQQYFWLLDRPDLAARLWRFLGAKVTPIDCQGPGRFCYQDSDGSRIVWDTVAQTPNLRIWFAEGKVKPGILLPSVTVKALVVMHHTEGSDDKGHPAIQHQVQLYLQTDNQAVALAARLLGASAPHVAEQYVQQIQMFYGAMAWYLDQNPKHAAVLLAKLETPAK